MKLRRLELQGYKTFASRTAFDFDSGITAIVGPNGSGKSNIADALRWVLGEQSYGTLRSKRTVDMIFSGSQQRARAGMAQAILTLDNSDGWLPIDFQEVVIGRRAYRSGENEYLLNGQKVRLRDVQELLATSGLGERTYTIVGQGLIDQALSLRAEERRALFEEAAGVSHYQAKRATTLRRLQETQHNLERVQDILSEIRPRLGGLKRQANRAINFEQVQRDLRHLLRLWYGHQWEARKAALRAQRQDAEDAEEEWTESRTQLGELRDAADETRRVLGALQRQLAQIQEEREQVREQHDQAHRHTAILRERASLHSLQITEIESELPRLEKQQAEASLELDGAVAHLVSAKEHLVQQEQHLATFKQGYHAQQLDIKSAKQAVSHAESGLKAERHRLSEAEGQLAQMRERLAERRNQQGHAEELAASEAALRGVQENVRSAQMVLTDRSDKHQEVQRAQQEARQALDRVRQTVAAASQRLNELNQEVARLEARVEMLDQMRQRDAVSREGITVLGRLASLIRIPAAHEEAIEAALGARLATLILPDGANLWQLLQQNSATVLHAVAAADVRPRETSPTPARPGVIGWAHNIVQTNGAPTGVVRLLLGDVLLVRERETAYAAASELPAGAMAVTPDGFVVHAGGLVEVNPRDPQRSILAREEAWRAAAEEVRQRRQVLATAQKDVASREAQVAELQEGLNHLDDEDRRLAHDVQEATQTHARYLRELDRCHQQVEYMRRQQAAAREEAGILEQRIDKTEASIAGYQLEVVRLEQAVETAQLRLSSLPIAEAEQERRNRRQDIETARTIVAGREAVVESRRSTLAQIEAQLRRQRERLQQIAKEQQELDLDGAERQTEQLRKQMAALDARREPLQKRHKQKQAHFETLEEEIAAAQRRTHDYETYYTQMKLALSQQENALEGLIERIRNDLGLVALSYDEGQGGQRPLPIDEIVEQLPAVTELPEDIQETIQSYRGQLHRMGSVNPDAPSEYEQTLERYEFLTKQIDDLQKTEKRLRQVIAELDDLTSRAFATTVANVDKIFGEMFTQLFGGGSAKLVLTDPDDLTISGVDIIARLPNRRQQRLGLLSGGERSLTAAALLFALLKVAPPPFSVLDEVDAMLDEANVTRFRAVLRDLAHQSQFIVITHNRGTVQAARTVYGVSMGTDSASQVISIRPEEYLRKK
jgi:chromosome segregation protein